MFSLLREVCARFQIPTVEVIGIGDPLINKSNPTQADSGISDNSSSTVKSVLDRLIVRTIRGASSPLLNCAIELNSVKQASKGTPRNKL